MVNNNGVCLQDSVYEFFKSRYEREDAMLLVSHDFLSAVLDFSTSDRVRPRIIYSQWLPSCDLYCIFTLCFSASCRYHFPQHNDARNTLLCVNNTVISHIKVFFLPHPTLLLQQLHIWFQFIHLFAHILAGNYDGAVFRYTLLICDFIDLVDWRCTDDFRAFAAVIYPSLSVSWHPCGVFHR